MKVQITEGTIFRIFVIAWVITVVIFTLVSVFPFGFVFGVFAGLPVGFLASFLYVQIMNMAFGEKEEKDMGENENKGFDFSSVFEKFREEERE